MSLGKLAYVVLPVRHAILKSWPFHDAAFHNFWRWSGTFPLNLAGVDVIVLSPWPWLVVLESHASYIHQAPAIVNALPCF